MEIEPPNMKVIWLGLQGDPASPFWRRSALGFLWKEWCWGWNSSTLATSWEELTHWKRLWCWEGLGARGEGDDRGWDGWWHHWPDGRESEWTPGVGDGQGGLACCDSWGRRVGHDWSTELKNYVLINNIYKIHDFIYKNFFPESEKLSIHDKRNVEKTV